MTRPRTVLLLGILTLGLGVDTALAQAVSGTVVDSASRQPIAGAVVQLLGPGGEERGRGLSDARGAFALRPSGDIRRVRVVRIGFLPFVAELARIASPGDATPLGEIAMRRIPAFLDPVRVVAAQCRTRGNRGQSPIGLIEQARAGLLTSVVTREQNPATMTRITYERRFDGDLRVPTQQRLRLDSATAQTRSFSAVQDAAGFVRRGFMDVIAGEQYFFAPDAEVLLDDRFAAGYCFRVMPRNRDRPREIGLGFEPADRRPGRVDVEGALWIDTVARELRELEFRYVGLDRRVASQEPGGSISFHTLTNGMVVVDRWQLRMIGATTDTVASSRAGTVRLRGRFIELHSGGELTGAAWADGTRFAGTLGSVRGSARWPDGTPARATWLALSNTPYRSATDDEGRFAFSGLIPGRYRVVVVDSALLSVGLSIPTELHIRSDRDSLEQDLVLPSRADLVAEQCRREGSAPPRARPTYLLGRALRSDGSPIEGATWSLRAIEDGEWTDLAVNGRTGSDGTMPYCAGLRRGMQVELIVRSPEGLTDAKRLVLEDAATIVPVVFPRP